MWKTLICKHTKVQRFNQFARRPVASLSNRDKLLKMLKYRSMERGMVENELILRQFYHKRVVTMPDEDLQEFQRFLDEPDPDMYKWFTNALPFPENYSNGLRQNLKQFIEKEFERGRTKEF